MTFDPRRICRELNAHGVRYVLVGGFAAAVHGSPLPTDDVDIVPARDTDNLDRLGAALTSLGARIRTGGEPVLTRIDGAFLAAMPFMLDLTRPTAIWTSPFAQRDRSRGTQGGLRAPVRSRSQPTCASVSRRWMT